MVILSDRGWFVPSSRLGLCVVGWVFRSFALSILAINPNEHASKYLTRT
ncbi:hypothetical protein ACVIN2_002883 [Bradyrhizobium sp. USDA 3650]